MTGVSTMTSKGQATIPEALRAYLGLVAGDKVYFEADTEEQVVKLKKAVKMDVASATYGSLKSVVKETNYVVARKDAGFKLGAKYKSVK
jgi:bifunctional DNA-binding transcriptional regulator/antitoxin component of YhaV-PrlF toxin-antitoxin module